MQESNVFSLRQEYQKHLQKELPQRAKGIAYEYVMVAGLFLTFAFTFFIIFNARVAIFFVNNTCGLFIYAVFIYYFFFGLPFYFYDDNKSTKRWAKKRYPKVYAQIYQFKQKDKQDQMVAAPFLLHIEGHKLFMGLYRKQGLIDTKATLTGNVLMDENANLVGDKELFYKAFLTYSYGAIGGVEFARQFFGRGRAFLDEWKVYVPRSQRFLIWQKRYLEESGCGQEWKKINELLPDLLEAGKDVLSLYEGRARFRKSIGYSFAHEFWYEDALDEQAMRHAFAKYMEYAYKDKLKQTQNQVVYILSGVEQNSNSWRKKYIKKALNKILRFSFEIQTLIDHMKIYGIPSEETLKQFELKTSYAKTVLLN